MSSTMKWRYLVPSIIMVFAAVATLSSGHASKPNLMGYYSICSFAPVSTVICLAIAYALWWIGRRRSWTYERAMAQAKKKAEKGIAQAWKAYDEAEAQAKKEAEGP